MSASPDRAARRAAYRERVDKKLATCKACNEYRPNGRMPATCAACGCFVAVKVRLPGEKCPRGRW